MNKCKAFQLEIGMDNGSVKIEEYPNFIEGRVAMKKWIEEGSSFRWVYMYELYDVGYAEVCAHDPINNKYAFANGGAI